MIYSYILNRVKCKNELLYSGPWHMPAHIIYLFIQGHRDPLTNPGQAPAHQHSAGQTDSQKHTLIHVLSGQFKGNN